MIFADDTWALWQKFILEKISSMDITPRPYPYYFVDQLFPEEMYEFMVKYWPNDKSFWGQNDIADKPLAHKEANYRKVVLMEDVGDFQIENNGQIFWEEVKKILLGRELVEAFVDRCFEFLNKERDDLNWSKLEIWSDALLQSDQEGFQLGPHHDSRHALFSNIIYLPDIGDDIGMGTIVYKPKAEFRTKVTNIGVDYDNHYHKTDNFEEVYRAPYKENSMFGFINSPRAFHGLGEIDSTKTRRRNILWSMNLNPIKPYKSVYKRLHNGKIIGKNNNKIALNDLIKLKGI